MNTIINLIQEESKRLYEFAVSFFESTRTIVTPTKKQKNITLIDNNVSRKEGEK